MQTVSVILGPIGWIASGAWLARDMMGPAYRKTVPAVVIVAALRQLAHQRDVIGNSPVDREDVQYLATTVPLDRAILKERYLKELRPIMIGSLHEHLSSSVYNGEVGLALF